MKKSLIALVCLASAGLSSTAFAAGNDAYPNGQKNMPGSSTAATPSSIKQSPGTVGAMKDAEKGSFTASKSAVKHEHLGN